MNPYYIQPKAFPPIPKTGVSTMNDIDKVEGGENTNYINMMNHPSKNYPSSDKTVI